MFFCDREDIYEEALKFFKYGKANGSFYHAMPFVLKDSESGEELVQWQESVRDQGHTTLGILLAGVICETAWNQGDDLYGLSDNRFMKAAEYAIKCNNLGEQEVPSTWYMRVGGNLRYKPKLEYYAGVNRWPAGSWRPIYYQVYNHYVNRKGLEMPCATQMIENADGIYMEGYSGSATDQLGWYSLTYANTGERVEDQPIQGELTDGVYRIVSALSGKSLVTNEQGELVSAPKGSQIEEWWLIKNRGDGEYTIRSMDGMAVQVNGEGTEDRVVNGETHTYSRYYLEGPAIGTGTADDSRRQRFAFLRDDDGLFRIVPSMTYYVWGLSGDNVNVIQWFNSASGAYNNDSSPGQRWIFEKATEVGTEFNFDEEGTGFSTVYAEAAGSYGLEGHGSGKAVSLNGTDQFLSITAKTGKSALAGETAFTVTCEVKPGQGSGGWIFYASPDAAQTAGKETYFGIREENGTITAVSCKDGVESVSVSAEGKSDWYQLSVVCDGAEMILYINGQELARKSGNCRISDILPEDSILQVGKANLEGGQYYKGLLDNLKLTGHAMTEGEVIKASGAYAASELAAPEVLADFTFDDE